MLRVLRVPGFTQMLQTASTGFDRRQPGNICRRSMEESQPDGPLLDDKARTWLTQSRVPEPIGPDHEQILRSSITRRMIARAVGRNQTAAAIHHTPGEMMAAFPAAQSDLTDNLRNGKCLNLTVCHFGVCPAQRTVCGAQINPHDITRSCLLIGVTT